MRTIKQTIYTFDELNESAKERARQWFKESHDLAWNEESRESIQAFCSHFGVKLKDWSIGAFCPFDYSTNAENQHFRGVKLRDFKREHTPTGYCLDCDLWMTFYDTFKRTGDAKGAFDAALWAGFKAWRDDLEWQYSDEYAEETILINEYEFNEEGGAA